MKAKYAAANLCLLIAIAATGWQIRVRWNAAAAARERVVRTTVQSPVVPAPPPVVLPEPATASLYADIATKDLFSKDRNPTIVIEAPKVEKPREMPALPVIYGVLSLPGGTRAMMAERAGAASKTVRTGEKVGEFSVASLDTVSVTFEWNGKQIERKVNDLMDRGTSAPAAPSGGLAAAPAQVSQNSRNEAQLREQVARTSPPPPQVAPTSAVGAEVGAIGRSERLCKAGDTSPAGAVVDGYRKVFMSTPFGTNCRWTPVQ